MISYLDKVEGLTKLCLKDIHHLSVNYSDIIKIIESGSIYVVAESIESLGTFTDRRIFLVKYIGRNHISFFEGIFYSRKLFKSVEAIDIQEVIERDDVPDSIKDVIIFNLDILAG
jgi:hypothetical protein